MAADCKRSFAHNPGFIGKRHKPEVIADALDKYAAGMSPAAIVQSKERSGIGVSGRTLRGRFLEYRDLLERHVDGLKVQVGYTWHAGEMRCGAKENDRWMFAVMGVETRFILGLETSPTKFGFGAANPFKARIERAGGPPNTPVTDGPGGFAKEYRGTTFKRGHPAARHVRDVAMRGRHVSNQVSERLNGDIRKATGRARGFGSANPALFGLWVFYHNFMKMHRSLGGTAPAKAAGIEIRANDKWLAPIQNAVLL